MNINEFSTKCQLLNLKYKEIFGSVPVVSDYYHKSNQEYLEALEKSIQNKKPIDNYLSKPGRPLDPNALT